MPIIEQLCELKTSVSVYEFILKPRLPEINVLRTNSAQNTNERFKVKSEVDRDRL